MTRSIIAFNIVLLLLCTVASVVKAAYCSGSPDSGERTSQYDISDSNMEFVSAIPNAKLYKAGPANARFMVLHVYGTPYEAGLAQGQILRDEIRSFISRTWTYLIGMAVEEMGEKFPPIVQALALNKGFDRALDWCAKVTEPFTPPEFFDEMRGIADGSGVDYAMVKRLNLFPELTKASCSFFGSWGAASTNGNTYQLRSLDYDTVGPFKDYPLVTVYHPSNGGHPYAMVSWPGSIGAITGISSTQMAISEIGVSFPDDSFGQGTENTPPQKVHGKPWMFVLRDVLQYASSGEEGVSRIQNDNRTCNLIIGVGDGKAGIVKGVQYSGRVANAYGDSDLLPVNDTWHPKIDGVVYNGMDWLCPTYTSVLGEQLQKYHGKIDEFAVIQHILPTVQTGDLHAAVSDLTHLMWYVSFARGSDADPSEPAYAYERQFTRLDMTALFKEPAPQ